jgi:hypothetical protein
MNYEDLILLKRSGLPQKGNGSWAAGYWTKKVDGVLKYMVEAAYRPTPQELFDFMPKFINDFRKELKERITLHENESLSENKFINTYFTAI